MRVYYLWLIQCFQIALLTAAAAADDSEHVHIKVHVPNSMRKETRLLAPPSHQPPRKPHQQHTIPHKALVKRPLPTSTAPLSSPHFDYEFRNVDPMYGPVLFNNDIGGAANAAAMPTLDVPPPPPPPPPPQYQHHHQTMSKKLMRQMFTPEMMSLINDKEDEEDTSHELNNNDASNRPVEGSDLFTEYLQQLSRQQQDESQLNDAPKYSSRVLNKNKKTIYSDIDDHRHHQEPAIQRYQQQQQQQRQYEEPSYYTSLPHRKQQYKHLNHIAAPHQMSNPLHWTNVDVDGNNSDEFETAEDISTTTSDSSEDMTTAFNKLQPISYQDMFGAYATPLASTLTATSAATATSKQPGQSYYQQIGDSNFSHPSQTSNWRQYHYEQQYQRPEVQQQQQQQQQYRHHKPKQQQLRQQQPHQQHQHKQKSQQTQFVLPSTVLRFTTSSSPSASSSTPTSPPLSLTASSPISSGFTGGSITSTGTLPWILPHDFVQKSQHQQQYHHHQLQQQQHQQQQLDAQQEQHKLQKSSSSKKRKNRNKPKRTRFVVK